MYCLGNTFAIKLFGFPKLMKKNRNLIISALC